MSGRTPSPARTPGTPSIIMSPDHRPWTRGNHRRYPVTVLGRDRTHDVALVGLDGATGLLTAPLGDSSAVAMGDRVVAIGNADGRGGRPLRAAGTIAGLDQTVSAADDLTRRPELLTGLIQITAALRPGDSGGPLVNSLGQVVGVDTAAGDATAGALHGRGYAIPINEALELTQQWSPTRAGHRVLPFGLALGTQPVQGQAGLFGQREGAGLPSVFQRRREALGWDFDDRAAFSADGVVVRINGQPIGGDPTFDRQGVQDALLHQGRHGAVHGCQIGRLRIARREIEQSLVDLGNAQMALDRLQHRQHRNPRQCAAQPMRPQQFTDPLGGPGIGRLACHKTSVRSVTSVTNRFCKKLA